MSGNVLSEKQVVDGLLNAITGMGTRTDKNAHNMFVQNPEMTQDTMEAMYRTNWVAGKVVDLPANDMTREWRSWEDIEEEDVRSIEQTERKLRYQQKINEALRWARLYGGAAILLKVNDGLTPDQPLNLDAIGEGDLEYMAVMDRYEMSASTSVTTDPLDPNYRKPEFYTIQGTQIHHTRVVRFEGESMPRNISTRTDHWGDSVLYRMLDDIENSAQINNSIAALFHEANLDVLKIPGLMHLVGDCEGERQLMKRLQTVNLSKSLHNMFIIDDQEEYDKKPNQIVGLSSTIFDYMALVAGAADIPVTRLLGVSPGGLNATGESDLRNYYDRIKAEQEANLRDQMEYIDNIMLISALGNMPENREFCFDPLWQMSEKEQAEVDKLRAERDTAYQGVGVPDSSIFKKIQEEGTYSIEDSLIEELEAIEEEDPEEASAGPDEEETVIDPNEEVEEIDVEE